MNQKEFDEVFSGLTDRRREVLQKVLNRETNEAIAKSLTITPATVRKHIEEICDLFGIPRGTSGKRHPRRNDLIALFAKYKPELLHGDTPEVLDPPKVNVEERTSENSDSVGVESAMADSASEDIEALVQKVREHPQWHDKIQYQCGTMRMLDITKPIALADIYTDVNVLEELPSQQWLEISDLVRGFNPESDNFDRLGLGRVDQERVPGLEALSLYSRLMVLGKPGSGKTTFLQWVAVNCDKGKFQSDKVPIFIRLKNFAEDTRGDGSKYRLLNYIIEEFVSYRIADKSVIERILIEGRALIMLDGLDEVLEKDEDEVIRQINFIVEKYFKNQFIITCRIAAYKYKFKKFTDVEVTDFNGQQVESFAKKWFVAVAKNSKKMGEAQAAKFIKTLQRRKNQQIRELAVTPILLNLTCLVFSKKASLPSNRAKLYEEGLEILLNRWDRERGIERDEVYRDLTVPHKFKLLTEIATILFKQNEYFFEQNKAEKIITKYLSNLMNRKIDLIELPYKSKAVLKSIEAQHGLLVERARKIYSFSHLTFQEYLTARWITSNEDWQCLLNHISSKNWREVFLLVLAKLESADDLIQLMKQRVDGLVAADEKLQQYLVWVHRKSLALEIPCKRAAVRANYFLEPLARDFGSMDLPDLDIERNFSQKRRWIPELDRALDPQIGIEFAKSGSYNIEMSLSNILNIALDSVLCEGSFGNLERNLEIVSRINFQL
jgi:predicted NACHT family NTPase